MHPSRPRLGQLLVEAHIITPEQLAEMLELQKTDSRRLGTLLLEAGLLNETQLTQILSQQLNAPWVSLYHIDFSRRLLNLIPKEIAERYCLVPIYVRNFRGQGDTLYVAMDDPANQEALDACKEISGLPTRAMIAPPSDIRNAINVYYAVRVVSSRRDAATVPQRPAVKVARLVESVPPPTLGDADEALDEAFAPGPPLEGELEAVALQLAQPIKAISSPPPRQAARRSSVPPPALGTSTSLPTSSLAMDDPFAAPTADAATSSGSLAAARSEALGEDAGVPTTEIPETLPEFTLLEHRQSRRVAAQQRGGKTINLTLLDGTTIKLPSKGARPTSPDASPEESQLTMRELLSALRAASHGADAPSSTPGSNARWEALFSALLTLLVKKHLITDWEFIEELKKI